MCKIHRTVVVQEHNSCISFKLHFKPRNTLTLGMKCGYELEFRLEINIHHYEDKKIHLLRTRFRAQSH